MCFRVQFRKVIQRDFYSIPLFKISRFINPWLFFENDFHMRGNGAGYGKCGILKPNLCPPDRMLFSCNIFIFKQSARICYSRCWQQYFFISNTFQSVPLSFLCQACKRYPLTNSEFCLQFYLWHCL